MDTDRLTWLVKRRELAQRLVHDLHLVLNTNEPLRNRLEAKAEDCSIFGLFVGIAFSLWRAVFLIDADRAKWETILGKAEQFLSYLAEDNSITYDREKTCRSWTVGFFLNNARYRLERVRAKLPEVSSTSPFIALEEQRAKGIDNDSVQDHWDTIYRATDVALLIFLRSRKLIDDRMFISNKDGDA